MWFPKVLDVFMLQLLIYSHHNKQSMVSHSNDREHIKLLLCTNAYKRTMVFGSTNRDHAQAVVLISWQQEEHGFFIALTARVVMPSWQQKVPKILTYTLPKDCLDILTKVRA